LSNIRIRINSITSSIIPSIITSIFISNKSQTVTESVDWDCDLANCDRWCHETAEVRQSATNDVSAVSAPTPSRTPWSHLPTVCNDELGKRARARIQKKMWKVGCDKTTRTMTRRIHSSDLILHNFATLLLNIDIGSGSTRLQPGDAVRRLPSKEQTVPVHVQGRMYGMYARETTSLHHRIHGSVDGVVVAKLLSLSLSLLLYLLLFFFAVVAVEGHPSSLSPALNARPCLLSLYLYYAS
jgi:hypothetical protein